MARVVVAEPARQDLADLVRSHSLPASARDRVRRAIEPLAAFPLLGPALEGRWDGFRLILGPWPWMLIVYAYDEEADLVIVVTIQDARSGTSPRSVR
jgi:plasmid stabilization system protein ParE